MATRDHEVYEFNYIIGKTDADEDIFILCENLRIQKSKKIKKGKIYIRMPNWAIMHELNRISSYKNPFDTRKSPILQDKLRDQKIKHFLIKIQDQIGNEEKTGKDLIDNLDPALANFILLKIDDLIDEHYVDSGLTDEDSKALAYDTFMYYKGVFQQSGGKGDPKKIPIPPSIVLVRRLAELFHINPDEIKKLSRRTVDEIFLCLQAESNAREQIAVARPAGKKKTK